VERVNPACALPDKENERKHITTSLYSYNNNNSMEVSSMGTVTISLDKTLTRKVEKIREKCYPSYGFDDTVREFCKDSINAKISDAEIAV